MWAWESIPDVGLQWTNITHAMLIRKCKYNTFKAFDIDIIKYITNSMICYLNFCYQKVSMAFWI